MGAQISSALDCPLDLPAYIRAYLNSDGDETFMVYTPVTTNPPKTTPMSPWVDQQENTAPNYSGPSQSHLRPNLIQDNESKKQIQMRNDSILAEIVDLCVDGIENPNSLKAKDAEIDGIGGKMFTPPKRSRTQSDEIWESASEMAMERGMPVRISPQKHRPIDGDLEEMNQEVSDSDVDSRVNEIVDSYPEDLKSLIRQGLPPSPEKEEKPTIINTESRMEQDEIQPKRLYHHQSDGSSNESESADSSNSKELPSEREMDQNDPVQICREEETRFLNLLNIVIHPQEIETDLGEWFLVESEWFKNWTIFLKGGDRPSTIENSKLVSEAGVPWPGLEPGTHYIAVDSKAWGLLSEVYGADMPIVRGSFDIYDEIETSEHDQSGIDA